MKPHAGAARRIKPVEGEIDLDTLVANARGASDFLKALAHEARLMILCLLVDGDCYSFNQGTFRFFGEPRGERRLEDKSELDLRAEWFLDVGAADGRLGVFLDVFNVTNQERVTLVEDRAGAAFEEALSLNSPRTWRLGLRYSF